MKGKRIVIYTDGSCNVKDPERPGGLGVWLQFWDGDSFNYEKKLSIGYKNTTIARMEMGAIIKALEEIKVNTIPVYIISDSEFIVKYWNNGKAREWRESNYIGVANPELWERIFRLVQNILVVKFIHVRGHGKETRHLWAVPGNGEADRLANYKQFKERYPDYPFEAEDPNFKSLKAKFHKDCLAMVGIYQN